MEGSRDYERAAQKPKGKKKVPFQAHAKVDMASQELVQLWARAEGAAEQLRPLSPEREVGTRRCRGLVMRLGWRWLLFH